MTYIVLCQIRGEIGNGGSIGHSVCHTLSVATDPHKSLRTAQVLAELSMFIVLTA